MLKRFIFLILFIAFLLSPLKSVERAYANELPQVIKIGYLSGYGFAQTLDTASARGFIFQLLERAESYSSSSFEYISYMDLGSMIKALKNKEIHIIAPISKRVQTDFDMRFSKKPLGQDQIILVKKGEDFATFQDPRQIDGKTVASYFGSTLEPLLDDYCKNLGISVKYKRTDVKNYHKLDTDYYLVTSLYNHFHNYNSVINLGSQDYYLSFLAQNEFIGDEIFLATEKALKADPSLVHRLYLKYYDTRLTRRDLTQQESALLKGKTFTVGYNKAHTPIQYTNENNKAEGVAVEILNVLATRYGFKVKYYPYSLDDEDSNHEGYDFLISLLGDYVDERKHYRITEEYFNMPLMLVTARQNAFDKAFQDRKANIGSLNYLTVDMEELNDEYPNSTIKVYNTLEELILAYDSHDIDALLINDTALTYLNTIFDNTLITYGNSLALPFRLFISRKLDPLYVNVFNLVFDYIRGGEFDEIVARQTLEFIPSYTITQATLLYKNEIIGFSIGILGIYLFTLYYANSRKKLAVLKALEVDPVTGLMSYSFFENKIKKVIQQKDCNEYAVISLDIDSFKTVTSYYNYENSQKVLEVIAHSLVKHLADFDAAVTRSFADNFVVICKNVEPDFLRNILEKEIRPQALEHLEENFPLTFSVGIYPILDCKEQIYHIVDWANVARQRGKNSHNTTIYTFDDKMKYEHRNKLNVTYRMEKALINNEFILLYQPKINLTTLQISGAEALVRWKISNDEIIYPDDFIPVFEANGYINKLDIYIFTKVCRFIKENEEFFENKVISVNISNRTMLDPTIVGRLKMIADNFSVNTKMIELEITESALGEEFAMKKIREFKSMGFTVSIDDFGAGVSSLNRLGSMEADVLKLDKAFLDSAIYSERGKIVIEDTIKMAKHLHMKIVAEGVETSEQAKWLQNLSCDVAQGYYFSRPISAEDFLVKVKNDEQYRLAIFTTSQKT